MVPINHKKEENVFNIKYVTGKKGHNLMFYNCSSRLQIPSISTQASSQFRPSEVKIITFKNFRDSICQLNLRFNAIYSWDEQ